MHSSRSQPIRHDANALVQALHASAATGVLIPAPEDEISFHTAYAIQKSVFDKRAVQLAGWKLGATSAAAQKSMKLRCPIVGRLALSDIVRSGMDVESPRGTLYAEAELAVTLCSDLPPRHKAYAAAEVASAIGEVHAAVELCTSRFANDDVPAAALIADDAFAYRLVIGRTLAIGWNPEFATIPVSLGCGAGRAVRGSAAAVMGNPIEAATWLANWLSHRGEGLKSGQIIATGSCTGVTPVNAGETVRASFADLEVVAVTIIPHRSGLGDPNEH